VIIFSDEAIAMPFDTLEEKSFVQLLEMAIAEDVDSIGDLTSKATLPPDLMGKATLVGRTDGILAGIETGERVLKKLAPDAEWFSLVQDGASIKHGTEIAKIQGPIRGILSAERIILNFIQRLSGIASLASKFVTKVKDLPVKILDTRKTTPGWRYLDKFAVRCGGGCNHRMNLSDGILIKDNHLAALGGGAVAIRKSILLSRQYYPGNWDIEVEVEDMQMFETALQSSPTIILLDNMCLEDMKAAVDRRNAVAPEILLEASGGINIGNVRDIALTGVDRISIGAITHSAPALDLALDYNFL